MRITYNSNSNKLASTMDQSVVINPTSGDPSGDVHPSPQAVVSLEAGVVSKKSNTYNCHFCGRLCRNAQALGGHMNVHRRERALAKQLVELRNINHGENLKGTSAATTGVVGVVAVAASSGNAPAAGEGELQVDHHHQEEGITHGVVSSASSSSPPSPRSIAIACALMQPRRSLHRLPSKNRKRREALDLELRLGFSPGS